MHKDERVKYIPLEETSSPVISKGDNHIGSIMIDPSIICKQHCYLGLSLNSSGNILITTKFIDFSRYKIIITTFMTIFQLEVNG